MLCCGYTLTDFPIFIRLTSLALWQSNDCPSASKATLMNMDKYFMRIHYERLHNHNKAKHNKTVCIFLGIYCTYDTSIDDEWTYNVNNFNIDKMCWLYLITRRHCVWSLWIDVQNHAYSMQTLNIALKVWWKGGQRDRHVMFTELLDAFKKNWLRNACGIVLGRKAPVS